jgi:hypothetical protein
MENDFAFMFIAILLIGRSYSYPPSWLCPFWLLISFRVSQSCLYFMMHITLLNLYDTFNDTVAIHHGSDVFTRTFVGKSLKMEK